MTYQRSARSQAALLVLDIQENLWMAANRMQGRKPKGYAKLQHVFEYLVETDMDENERAETAGTDEVKA